MKLTEPVSPICPPYLLKAARTSALVVRKFTIHAGEQESAVQHGVGQERLPSRLQALEQFLLVMHDLHDWRRDLVVP